MRTLKTLIVILVMLAITAPSFGYILVYNASCRLKAVDSESDSLVGASVKGYLIIDVNEADGDVNDAYWISYGKDALKQKVYTLTIPELQLSTDGKYQTLYMNLDDGWYMTAIGKTASKSIGLAQKTAVAPSMAGNLLILDSAVFDMTQSLRGSGTITMTLNSAKTKAANAAVEAIDDVLTDITTALEAGGYEAS